MTPDAPALSLWSRFLEFPFYQHALLAGGAIAIACALLSVFVVQRRMAFIGQGISHAAFGGVGIALVLELALPALRVPFMRDAIVAIFCVLSAILMGRIARARQVGEDAAIGVALAVAMALGVICIDVRAEWVRRLSAQPGADLTTIGYTPSFHDLLFGNILSISRAEVYLACIVSGAVVLWVALVYKGLVLYAADEEAATVLGLPVGMLHYGLLASLGVTVVVAMRLLGVILVSGLLILPGIIAGFWARRMRATIAVAIGVSLLSIVIGLGTSMSLHVLSTGPVIVLVLALAFALSWIARARAA
jgi:ABC-type Mn2+/Zn2+ transport system permease subunit